ncbi:ANM_HP_G0130360.mRNA.1.CDS.1 [Saccharomyces cerevisiae]|nr:ANM_HP_G0130360.mRNA.1.CDS.1 [Saccharomyces cerevisiae]CAI6654070.1 ANM_HP_G0130360.mRNA.1.CDS.1 [Saccharomyces cerevisiae]
MTSGYYTVSFFYAILLLCACTRAEIYLTGGESQGLPSGFWQMDDDLAIAPVSMVEFYQTIGLTANGTVPESFNKRDATEYPNIISNITTQAANFTQHSLVEHLQNDVTAISISNAINVAVDGSVETPADLQYNRNQETGESTLWQSKFYSYIAQWVAWAVHGSGDKKFCGSQEFTNIFFDGQEGWSLFVKTWSTNSSCDITASEGNLTCAVRVSVSSMHNHGKTAFCVTYSHGDSWRAELRVVANDAWSHYYPWSIDCPEVDKNNMAINDCFDQAQG